MFPQGIDNEAIAVDQQRGLRTRGWGFALWR